MFYFPILEGVYPHWVPFFGGDSFIFFRPVFNVADSAITTGVMSLLIFQRQFFKTQHESPVEKNTATSEDVSSDLADNSLKADE
jgi:signal peptidase II